MRKLIAGMFIAAAVATALAAVLSNPARIAPKTKVKCPPSCVVREHKEVRPPPPPPSQHVHKEVVQQLSHKVAM